MSSVVSAMSWGGLEDALALLRPILDLLGGLSMNFCLHSQTDVYHFQIEEKCVSPESEIYFCIVMKLGPYLQEICHVSKLKTMQ